ncbi:MAG TPA: glutamine synthetase family protein [Candidatus Binatia bacterium]|nr:glutamine synthetase family protein [Candidatus Binatia bacterium]
MAAKLEDLSVGKLGFVADNRLWSEEQQEAATRVLAEAAERRLTTVRISFGDQHGILRGKTITAHNLPHALENGIDFPSDVLVFDTANDPAFPVFAAGGGFGLAEMTGIPDVILVPDPLTFRVLPWAPGTGWLLGDMYFDSGRPVPFATRQVLRDALRALHGRGMEYVAGLEVEFYVTRLEDPMLRPEQSGKPPDPPRVSCIAHGFQYMTESRNDEIDGILQVLHDNLVALGLPLRSMEDEWGPGQCEFTFDPLPGLGAADAMLLFRTATKQLCRRHGYLATFMCRPGLPNLYSSGWHLHESVVRTADGTNLMSPSSSRDVLSEFGRHFVGGLLAHARASTLLSTPTINGYKRYKPFSLAPDRVTWGRDNRAAMIRVCGDGPNTHVENRIGEPAANPYLYMTSQIWAGLDGVDNAIDPGPPSDEPYAESDHVLLPRSIMEATEELKRSALFRRTLGDAFVDYLVRIKEHEIERFLSHVTDWEHREYFEVF